jgi:hypothetical protein
MSNANVTTVQSMYAAFGKGDIATIIAGVTPDIDWHSGGRISDFPAFGPRKGPKGRRILQDGGGQQRLFRVLAA